MRSFTCPICRANLIVDEEEIIEDEEESVDHNDHSNREIHGRHHQHRHYSHHAVVRRGPETPSATEGGRRRTYRGRRSRGNLRQMFRVPPAAAAEAREDVRATLNRPTLAVYYPRAYDPFFMENEEDAAADGNNNNNNTVDQHRNNTVITNTINCQVRDEIDSWGQEVEVDWDGASCRCHHRDQENISVDSHGRNNRHRQFDNHHSYNGNDRNAAEMFERVWETDASGPSSSTVAFHCGFQERRGDWQQTPEQEEADHGEIDTFALNLPGSQRNASGFARRPVTRSMSRGL